MLTVPTVETCPYTVAGKGVLRIAHPILGTLAGAVHDKLEWLALLVGTRSSDGLTITVDSLRIPLQERGTVDCALVEQESLDADVVGVVHSHHSMRAFFSTTDHDTLNPRFPVSLVVAQESHNCSEAEQLLGFTYQAEGRAPLPCGSNGVIAFTLLPNPIIDLWSAQCNPGFDTPNTATSLRQCPRVERSRVGLIQQCLTACGITANEKATAIFGSDGQLFMKEVEHNTRGKRFDQGLVYQDNRHYFGKDKRKGSMSWEDERDTYLRHWGEY